MMTLVTIGSSKNYDKETFDLRNLGLFAYKQLSGVLYRKCRQPDEVLEVSIGDFQYALG